MPKINRETRQKATDSTFGVFRRLTITRDEVDSYKKIQRLEHLQHLGNIQTAYLDVPRVVLCVAECLEGSRATLKELHT